MSLLDFVALAANGLPEVVGSTVYKDDCMFSFETAENNANGLDVCMNCFQAFARAEHFDYTAAHYANKRHPLYLNIKKLLKPVREEPSPKIQKLEIKEQKELDVYDTTTALYVAPKEASLALDQCPEMVQVLASEILSARSAALVDDIKSWEMEIRPCQHSQDIQLAQDVSTNTGVCFSCDLTQNLWLCLSCGTIGCGREQFGSDVKGNSHALAHFESSAHPVAVKLGSLSANPDSCDCYCYACNDEVKVPSLDVKLKTFGIDLTAAVKSEKSLVELNIDTNRAWQFNLDDVNGEKLHPVFGADLTGISNLGNSCYINSVVQALFSLDNYKSYFSQRSVDLNSANPAADINVQMQKLYEGLSSGRYSKPSELKGDEYQAGIKLSSFKTLIGADHPEFSTNKQQDASEFLLYLLDKLDKQFGLELNRDLKFLFGTKVICTLCQHGFMNNNLVDNLVVNVPSKKIGEEDGKAIYAKVTLEDCFKEYCNPTSLDTYHCDHCDQSGSAVKLEGFKTFPKNLLVSAQRIALENWVPVKLDVPIEIPSTIDLREFEVPQFTAEETEMESPTIKSAQDFTPDAEALQTLLGMGFGELRCQRALYNTGNKNAEDAMNWLFAHMEDPDIDAPFDPAPVTSESEISEDAIANVAAMGFSPKLSKKALLLNSGDPNAAVEWLFNNPEDDGEMSSEPINLGKETEKLTAELENAPIDSTVYDIRAVVCHKGSSPHTGHYVVFVKKNNKWVLFNDEKVVECGANIQDMVKNAYIYFLVRR